MDTSEQTVYFFTPRYTQAKAREIFSSKDTNYGYYRSGVIDIFRSMIEDSFLRIIDTIAANPHSGYIFLQMSLQLFELIEQYSMGESSRGKSRSFASNSLQRAIVNWFNVKEDQVDIAAKLADFLIDNARQGLIHDFVSRKVIITNTKSHFSFNIEKETNEIRDVSLEPWTFYEKTKILFYDYINSLSYEDELFKKFEKRMLEIVGAN